MYVIDIPELVDLATGASGTASEVASDAPQATPSLKPASAASSWLQSSLLHHAPEPVFQETTSRCVRFSRGPPVPPTMPEDANAAADAWTAPSGNADLSKVKSRKLTVTHSKASDTTSPGFLQTQHRRHANADASAASAVLLGRQLEHTEADPTSAVDFQTTTWVQPALALAACRFRSHHQRHANHVLFHLPATDADAAPAPIQGCTGPLLQCTAARGVAGGHVTSRGRGQAGAPTPARSQEAGLPAGPNPGGHSRLKRDSRAREAQEVAGAETSKRPRSSERHAAVLSVAGSERTWSGSVGETDPLLAEPELAVPAAAPPAQGVAAFLGLTSPGAPVGGRIPAVGAAAIVAAGTSSLLSWRPAAQRGVTSQLPSGPSGDLHGEASHSSGRPKRYDGYLSVLQMVQPGAEGRRPDLASGGQPQQLPAQAGIRVGAEAVSLHLDSLLEVTCSGVDSKVLGGVVGPVVEAGGVPTPALLQSVGTGGNPALYQPDQPANERTPGLAPSCLRDGSTWSKGTNTAAALPVTGPAPMPAVSKPCAQTLQQMLSGRPDPRQPSDDRRRPAGREALLQALIALTTRYYVERGLPID